MARHEEPEFDPDEYNTYKLQVLTLADGTVTLYLSHDWKIREQSYVDIRLVVPWVDGADLFIELKTYEDAECVATNKLAHLLAGELFQSIVLGDHNAVRLQAEHRTG